MRKMVSYFAIAAGVGILTFIGCSASDTTAPPGNAGATAQGATVASSSTGMPSSVVGTGTGTGAGGSVSAGCTMIFKGNCATCMEATCCTETSACNDDMDCNACLNGQGAGCNANPLFTSMETCLTSKCTAACIIPNECNPITNEGCTNGAACDVADALLNIPLFGCFGGSNTVALCGTCNDNTGPYCKGGTTCLENEATCSRYCCDDGDCGTGTCDKTLFFGGVGICITGSADVAAPKSSCDAPATSPSNGSCVMLGGTGGGGAGGSTSSSSGNGGAGGSTSSSTGKGGAGGSTSSSSGNGGSTSSSTGKGGAGGSASSAGTGGAGGSTGKGGAGGSTSSTGKGGASSSATTSAGGGGASGSTTSSGKGGAGSTGSGGSGGA